MCGIAGIISLGASLPPATFLQEMLDRIAHRGPDDQGLLVKEQVMLGHRRLSIIDTSQAGHQPMRYAQTGAEIVYNGEIYNYLELRQSLQALGYFFETQTDTEVILAAYDYYGIDCVNHFNGMWAFAIWDPRQERLFCSRDRFGIKPFYYTIIEGCLYFASEIKAFLKLPNFNKTLSEEAIYLYLQHGLTDYQNHCFFKHVHPLLPAHHLIIAHHQIQHLPYWQIPTATCLEQDPQRHVETFREIFRDSVKLRLRSDVSIGSCLSGGLDSSSIVCTAHDLLKHNQQLNYQQATFSSCFEQPQFDERQHIQKIIQVTGAEANYVFPNAQDLQTEIEDLIYQQDEPFGSLSSYAQWCVMKTAHQKGVKVILDGQGADEILAGYGFQGTYWQELIANKNYQRFFSEAKSAYQQKGNLVFRRLPRALMPKLLNTLKTISNPYLSADFTRSFSKQALVSEKTPFDSQLKNELYQLFASRLPNLLRSEDRNSMAFSIEARVPFLDYRLVEYAFSLPDYQLIQEDWSKWILRKSMDQTVPDSIRWRTDKMGFVTPQEQWLQNELRPWSQGVLSNSSFLSRPYWNGRQVLKDYQKSTKGLKRPLNALVWRMLNLEIWLNQNG